MSGIITCSTLRLLKSRFTGTLFSDDDDVVASLLQAPTSDLPISNAVAISCVQKNKKNSKSNLYKSYKLILSTPLTPCTP